MITFKPRSAERGSWIFYKAIKAVSLFLFVMLFFTAQAYCASSKTCYLQGNKYFSSKKYDRAIDKYKKAIKINPKIAKYYYKLAEAYRLKELGDEAITYYEKAIKIYPGYYS
ncbi:MAG: tetratricopeptide repeat protein, partial [Thermodesulfobacteriota bacterium]|nr:tetratricopeptide repeat protein [Thermodesulfobacteriota bacterium]